MGGVAIQHCCGPGLKGLDAASRGNMIEWGHTCVVGCHASCHVLRWTDWRTCGLRPFCFSCLTGFFVHDSTADVGLCVGFYVPLAVRSIAACSTSLSTSYRRIPDAGSGWHLNAQGCAWLFASSPLTGAGVLAKPRQAANVMVRRGHHRADRQDIKHLVQQRQQREALCWQSIQGLR